MRAQNPHVVVIDHFDSFTYNLVVALERISATVEVLRTDVQVDRVRKANPTHIVLSPGPGHPGDVPLFQEVIGYAKPRVPILGVCLGHQAIGMHFGGIVERFSSKLVMHGKLSPIKHDGTGIFASLPTPLTVCRYHSLAISERTIAPDTLRVTARAIDDGSIMGVTGVNYPNMWGVQFHPESFFTEHGATLLTNFLNLNTNTHERNRGN